MEENIANHLSDKQLIFKIYNKLIQLTSKYCCHHHHQPSMEILKNNCKNNENIYKSHKKMNRGPE